MSNVHTFKVLVNGSFRGNAAVHEGETVAAVDQRLTEQLSLPATHRLLVRGKTLSDPEERFPESVSSLYVIESSEAAVAAVKAAKADPLVRGFSSKPSKYAARPGRSGRNVHSNSPYKFHATRALPGYADKAKAEALLETLANDPGFLRVMQERQYSVGCLSEMEPEGKVGVDPVCVLGLNVNKGQEIRLRLRTDDKKGFRPMYMLKQVLAHELAHNVFSEHDDKFFDLMRKIEREAKQYDWREGGGRSTGGSGPLAASVVEGRDPLDEVAEGPSLSIVRRLGSGPTRLPTNERPLLADSGKASQPVRSSLNNVAMEETSDKPPAVRVVEGVERTTSGNETAIEADMSGHCASASCQHGHRDPSPAREPPIAHVQKPGENIVPKRQGDLDSLTGMGFSKPMAKVALKECDDDAERAADWLLSLSVDGESGTLQAEDGTVEAHAKKIQDALIELRREAGHEASQLEEAILTLYLYVRNLLNEPGNQRYREINASNAAFARRVGRFESGAHVLRAIGYTLQDSGRWMFDGSLDIARLWLAKSLLVQSLYRYSAAENTA